MMRTFNLFLILSTLLGAWPAAAQSNASGGTAPEQRSFPELVQSAQKAYSNGSYDRAIDDLVHAYSKRSNARLLFNIAKSYQKKGDCAAALVYFRAYVNHPANEKNLMAAAQKEMDRADECAAYDPSLAGRLAVDTTPQGATVTVDGTSHGTTPTEVVPLESGTHNLEIEREGYEPVEIQLTLKAGQPRTINQILQEKSAPAEPPEAPATPQKRRSLLWPIHPAALALGGAGIGGMTVGVIYDAAVLPNTDDQRQKAKNQGNSARFQKLTDRRQTQKTVALIGYVGGGLLLASGITWHVIDVTTERRNTGSARRAPESDPVVTFGVGPQSVEFGVRF